MAENASRLEGSAVDISDRGLLTVEPGPCDPDIYALLAERIDVTRWRPKLAAGVESAEFALAGGGTYFMVANPDRSLHYQLSAEEAELLRALDGETSIGELVVDQLTEYGELDTEGVVDLIRMLATGGFLVDKSVDVYAALDRALHPPTPISRLDRFFRTLTVEWSGAERMVHFVYRNFVRRAFNKVGVAAVCVTAVLGLVAFIDVTSTHNFHLSNRHFGIAFVVLLALDLGIIFVHEMGHAIVLAHYRRRIRGAGFRIYFGSPAFFIDSADALMLSTPRRIFQSAAGPIFELVGTSIAAIALWGFPGGTPGRTLYQFIIINYFVMFLNVVPMLELDGYWMLSDALHQPALRPESLIFIRHDMWRKLRRRERFTRRDIGLGAFGIAGVAFTIFSFASAWFFWRRVFGDTISAMWHGGVGGKLLLLVLALFLGGPTIRLLIAAGRSLLGRIRSVADRVRFRLETSWRVEGATLLDESGLFGDVPADVLSDIAGRIRLRTLAPGAILIRQGDPSEEYFLVRTGQVEILEERRDGTTRTLRVEGRGAGIGDQGLIEGSPRSATVRAIGRSEVFQIDKPTFERLLSARATRPAYAPTVQLVEELRLLPLFAVLSSDALTDLSQRGWWVNLRAGDPLFSQGDPGETFYVIEHGRLVVEIDASYVRTLTSGDYVGELALLRDAPRSATVLAETPARLFAVDRSTFDSLIAEQFRQGRVKQRVLVEAIRYH